MFDIIALERLVLVLIGLDQFFCNFHNFKISKRPRPWSSCYSVHFTMVSGFFPVFELVEVYRVSEHL